MNGREKLLYKREKKMTDFAQKLNDLLNQQPEKPVTIARMAKISPDDISKYKRGKRFPENREKVNRLLSVIRCSASARDEVKNAWKQEYMARKYKEDDAWECIKEVLRFLQSESLTSDIYLYEKKSEPRLTGGVLCGSLDVRKYLEAFLSNSQEREIKMWGNEEFVENLSSIPYSKETQYLHLIHSESNKKTSKWIHTVCGMLLRMISCPQYYPMIVYGNNGWAGQLFSGAVISEKAAVFISEDAEQGIVLRDNDQIRMINHYFMKIREQGKPIAVTVKQGEWYRVIDDAAIFIQGWIELDRITKRKGTYYITSKAIQTFSENNVLWDRYRNEWYQYKSKLGKKSIFESILKDSKTVLIDSDLMPLKTNLTIEFCEERFLRISVVAEYEIRRYEVCEPELIRWIGCTLKEISDSEFVMSEQRKQQFLLQMIENTEKENEKI